MTNEIPSIHEKIQAFYGGIRGDHDRYRSWEYCYQYFHQTPLNDIAADLDHAALQLGFYLASWGMYRGSGFLLQYTYTIHRGVIEQLITPDFLPLWQHEVGADRSDEGLIPLILNAASAIREAYRPFAPPSESHQASDTLVTKVILGTLGALPAFDSYFVTGYRSAGFRYPRLNTNSIEQLLDFCHAHLDEFRGEQARIAHTSKVCYPLMKLADMYFWQIGYEKDFASNRS